MKTQARSGWVSKSRPVDVNIIMGEVILTKPKSKERSNIMSNPDLSLQITKVNLELKPEGPAHTLAAGTVVYNHGLKIRVRVMDSKTGPFAKLPSFRIGEGNEAKWFDYVFFSGGDPKALRDDLNAKVVAEYNHIVAQYAEGEAVATTDTTDTEDDSPFDTEA
jgi:hypothetical protein